MGNAPKNLVGLKDNPTVLGILQMSPDLRESYKRGMFKRGEGQISGDEYAALILADEMDNMPGLPSSYGRNGRRGVDSTIPDDAIARFEYNRKHPPNKLPISETQDLAVASAPTSGGMLSRLLGR